MKCLGRLTCFSGLAGSAQAHVADMPVMVHAVEHGWLLLTVVALVAILSPLFRRRR